MSEIQKKTVLQVYRAPSGQISGRLFVDGDEVMSVAGCSTVEEARQAVIKVGYEVDSIKLSEGI